MKDSARSLVRYYVIISIFSVNSYLLNPNGLPIHQCGTWRSRVSTFPACTRTNASRPTRELQNRTLLAHEILSSIFPSSCDIFVTVVGLLRHGVTITYLPWSGELAGGRGSTTFRNVLFRRRNSPQERGNYVWGAQSKSTQLGLWPQFYTQRHSASW